MPITRHGYAERKRNGSTRAYRKARAAVLANADTCSICGQPPTADDPLVADHKLPVINGGNDTIGNLRAAHRSCNATRGASKNLS